MDAIHIKKLEIFANHGVFTEENVLGQKFVVSADLYLPLEEAGSTDDLTKSVHYGQAAEVIKEVTEKTTFKLIERLVEEIADELMNRFPIEGCRVIVEKPWAPVKLPLETVSVEITRKWHDVYIAMGSNMGDSEALINEAMKKLDADRGIRVKKVSSLIKTKPYGGVEQNDFLNGAAHIRTFYSPEGLLRVLNRIEAEAGRERLVHWGPRTLDLDIIFYEREIICTDKLVIPHADMKNRSFVLEPLCELNPYFIHPVYCKSNKELLEELNKRNPAPGKPVGDSQGIRFL